MISPSCSNGAKTALLVPTAIFAWPLRTRFHSSSRSPMDKPLWKTATSSPYRARNSAIICGVSAISGTMTITPLPSLHTLSISRIKTDVFPEPVTPYSSDTLPFPCIYFASSCSYAFCCSCVKTIVCFSGISCAYCGIRSTSALKYCATPFFTSASHTERVTPVK